MSTSLKKRAVSRKHVVRRGKGGGRPTRDQAEQRHTEMLDRALDMFLEHGFEQTTLDAIVSSIGMTKRTIYGRYDDKLALFRAAVQQAIKQWILPSDILRTLEVDDLEGTLLAVARRRIADVLSPTGLKIQRIIHVASFRFPDILASVYDQANKPVVEFLSDVLTRHHRKGTIFVDRPDVAAMIFMGMVIGGATRRIAMGELPPPHDVEDLMTYSIKLFLNGVIIVR
jgi:TetR/AcrR family transcriptional repressor of mexJK operon